MNSQHPVRTHRIIQPAPPRVSPEYARQNGGLSFYSLPPELRIEIYCLVLANVKIHVLPLTTDPRRTCPHPLVRTSKQVRNEVLPIIHSSCDIRAVVTDFNFTGLLAFLSRIPADDQKYLLRNEHLSVRLCTTLAPPGNLDSLRKWLHDRADQHRPQPNWRYSGPCPSQKVANDLKRRVKRMPEVGKQMELMKMVTAIGVDLSTLPNTTTATTNQWTNSNG